MRLHPESSILSAGQEMCLLGLVQRAFDVRACKRRRVGCRMQVLKSAELRLCIEQNQSTRALLNATGLAIKHLYTSKARNPQCQVNSTPAVIMQSSLCFNSSSSYFCYSCSSLLIVAAFSLFAPPITTIVIAMVLRPEQVHYAAAG